MKSTFDATRFALQIRRARALARLAASAGLAAVIAASVTALPHAQARPAAGTVKGFVRVNGSPIMLRYAYGLTAPDSFDPSVEVRLVLVSPAAIPDAALTKAATRNDVFRLVDQGAIVEIREKGHNVFIRHPALKGQQLQTGGDPNVKTSADRISGSVNTFMSGDEDSFGFKVRFEIAFDVPIVKRLPLSKATAAAPPPPPAQKAQAGPAPKSKAEAVKWLESQDLMVGSTPHDGLISYLTFKESWSADVVRAYLLAGATVTRPHTVVGGYALNMAALMCEKKPAAPEIVRLLLDAGANVNQKDADGPKATPPMLAVRCPDVLRLLLAAKPDLNLVDVRGFTVLHHALTYGPSKVTVPMLKEAGFDIARWTPSLKEAGLMSDLNAALAPPEPARPAPSAAAPAARAPAAPRASSSTAAVPVATVDWKTLGPYPQRSKAEATRMLSRPGAATTIDEHLWDAITGREPLRLAVALQAGANVRQTRAGTGYTPLVLLAERCDPGRDAEAQTSIAEQLIAAGADLTGVDATRANALVMAADDCPVGVVSALIKAGVPAQAASSNGITALKAAITASRVDVIDALLDAGVDPKKEPYNVGRWASGNKPVEAALKKKRK